MYYHKSNGRIERANRTIRDALRHVKKSTKFILKKVIENYNILIYRGIGMSPNETLNSKKWKLVLEKQESYKREFKSKKSPQDCFKLDEKVLIKNEVKKIKWMTNLMN
ncbi:hypothetical protein DMUE_3813 [Dictyocoela muelleri]|nr:hypothetical protein DMUE_3813 [Dictyocoela muelleri]